MGAKHKFIYLFITISLTCQLLQTSPVLSLSGEFVAVLWVTVCLRCYHGNCEFIL